MWGRGPALYKQNYLKKKNITRTVSRVLRDLPTGGGVSLRPATRARNPGDGNNKGTVSRAHREQSTGVEYVCGLPPELATGGMAILKRLSHKYHRTCQQGGVSLRTAARARNLGDGNIKGTVSRIRLVDRGGVGRKLATRACTLGDGNIKGTVLRVPYHKTCPQGRSKYAARHQSSQPERWQY